MARAAAAAAVVAACTWLTMEQTTHWSGKIAPLEHTLKYYPDNPAHTNNLGVIYWEKSEGKKGNPLPKTAEERRAFRQKAIEYWTRAVTIRPQFSDAWNNFGCGSSFASRE